MAKKNKNKNTPQSIIDNYDVIGIVSDVVDVVDVNNDNIDSIIIDDIIPTQKENKNKIEKHLVEYFDTHIEDNIIKANDFILNKDSYAYNIYFIERNEDNTIVNIKGNKSKKIFKNIIHKLHLDRFVRLFPKEINFINEMNNNSLLNIVINKYNKKYIFNTYIDEIQN